MMTLYARHEPTTDWLTLKYSAIIGGRAAQQKDVVLYGDVECTNIKGRYPWHYKRPDKRNKYIMHNCSRYALKWVN